jgi:hypothetical protein
MTNAAIKTVAEAPSAISCLTSNLVRAGFELEFQALDGMTQDGDGEIDTDALSEASFEAWCEENPADHIDGSDQYGALAIAMVNCGLEPHNIDNRTIARKVEAMIEAAQGDWRDEWENEHCDAYRSNNVYENLTAPGIRNMIDCGEDQSVSGGEIRTVGGLTPSNFVKTARVLLDKNEFTIDTGCSFHIHLSVPGVKHRYGSELQGEITAYLLENAHRMTEELVDRLHSDPRRKFACIQISEDKFTAVHYHSQGTWEFRLFGNVSTKESANRALVLAVEALQHAYRVRLGMAKSLLGDLTFAQLVRSYSDADLTSNVTGSARKLRKLLAKNNKQNQGV